MVYLVTTVALSLKILASRGEGVTLDNFKKCDRNDIDVALLAIIIPAIKVFMNAMFGRLLCVIW